VFVDHRAAALEEAGDLLMPLQEGRITAEHICAELGDLIANRVAGRQTSDEITLFKSVGLAVQDLFAAARALENAPALGNRNGADVTTTRRAGPKTTYS